MPQLRVNGGGVMRQDLTVIRGDSQELTLTLTGLPEYGLLGADLTFTVSTLLEKTLGDGIEVEDVDAGTVTITIDAGDTDDAPGRRAAYPYDVQVTFPDGIVKTPVRGLFIVIPDVTR